MDQVSATASRVSVSSLDRAHFASKALFLGGCLGIPTALVSTPSPATQLLIGGLLTLGIGGGIYWALLWLANRSVAVTDDSTTADQQPSPSYMDQSKQQYAVDGGSTQQHAGDDSDTE